MNKNHILISANLDKCLEDFLKKIGHNNYKVFEAKEFLVENAHDVISHAYIASDSQRVLILKAYNYNKISQNALLKLLEEPPENSILVLIAPSKSIFLPTIRSRLPVVMVESEYILPICKFDFNHISHKTIFEFLQKNRFLKQEEASSCIQAAYIFYMKNYKIHTEDDLEQFDKAFRLLKLNSLPLAIFTTILLLLLRLR